MGWWESAYTGSPPWDIGAPQPEIVKLVENNEIPKGRVLDIGCGTGDNSIFLAKNDFSVTCMDIAHLAIDKGKNKAVKQKVKVDFRVGDALRLDEYFSQEYFNAVVDSGLFHTLSNDERPIFAKHIRRVLVTGGKYFVLCFSDKEPGSAGPRRISKKEIEETFSKMFRINYIKDAFFTTRWDKKGPKAYLTSMTKIDHNRRSRLQSSDCPTISRTPFAVEQGYEYVIDAEGVKAVQKTQIPCPNLSLFFLHSTLAK